MCFGVGGERSVQLLFEIEALLAGGLNRVAVAVEIIFAVEDGLYRRVAWKLAGIPFMMFVWTTYSLLSYS